MTWSDVSISGVGFCGRQTESRVGQMVRLLGFRNATTRVTFYSLNLSAIVIPTAEPSALVPNNSATN
jgi:hypothetical protein